MRLAITALVIAMISIVGIVVVQSQSIIKDNDFEKKKIPTLDEYSSG
jgi:signal transduction histidine kinase